MPVAGPTHHHAEGISLCPATFREKELMRSQRSSACLRQGRSESLRKQNIPGLAPETSMRLSEAGPRNVRLDRRLPGGARAGGLRKAGREALRERDTGLWSQGSRPLEPGHCPQHHQTLTCL